MAIWLVMVPEGQNRAASMSNIPAAIDSSSLIEGSSANTSSPTFAFNIDSIMGGVLFVTVSERKSMVMYRFYLQYNQFTPQNRQLAVPVIRNAFHCIDRKI